MKSFNSELLFGKWNLISFRMKFLHMKWNWGKNATGWIQYDRTGRMSVNIKSEKSILPYFSKLIFGDILVYGGSYLIQGDLIVHHLEYCSKKSWNGKDLVREILILDENNLVLQGGNSLRFILTWAKDENRDQSDLTKVR
jgi:hypothetical protein